MPEQEKVKAFYKFLLHGEPSRRDFVQSVRERLGTMLADQVQVAYCWDSWEAYIAGEVARNETPAARETMLWEDGSKAEGGPKDHAVLKKASAVLSRDERAGGQLFLQD